MGAAVLHEKSSGKLCSAGDNARRVEMRGVRKGCATKSATGKSSATSRHVVLMKSCMKWKGSWEIAWWLGAWVTIAQGPREVVTHGTCGIIGLCDGWAYDEYEVWNKLGGKRGSIDGNVQLHVESAEMVGQYGSGGGR